MGVPAFFRWLTAKYPKVLVPAIEEATVDVDDLEMEVNFALCSAVVCLNRCIGCDRRIRDNHTTSPCAMRRNCRVPHHYPLLLGGFDGAKSQRH